MARGCNIVPLCIACVLYGYAPPHTLAQTPREELRLKKTHTRCELLGLGAVNTVPHNFPGADVDATERYRRMLNPGIIERSLASGGHAELPAILGGDLGAPFRHSDGKLHYVFGDAWFESPARSSACPASDPACIATVENNDLFASSASFSPIAASDCIALDMPRAPGTAEVQPLTWDGAANQGGRPLGVAVPGPGFSTGRYIFVAVPVDTPTCEATQRDCAAANGLVSDTCRIDATGLHRCYFGECGDSPDSPCAFRFNPNKLLVNVQGSDFTEPTVGVHVASNDVFEAYRGHFSAVSFYSQVDFATASGKVWVIGRDSFWGAPGLTMSPYLMYHPVQNGRLEAPLFFAGIADGEAVFSASVADALPVYKEPAILNQHTSFVFEPELDGGTWLMIYGGHAQPALRNNIALLARPVVDEIFYSRETGVYLRSAKSPWGPWSEPTVLFNPYVAGQGGYCEHMYFEDPQSWTGFQCPEDSAPHNANLNRAAGLGLAGEYGAAIIPGASSINGSNVKLRWLLSTWNPYRVIVQESELELVH